MPRSESRPWADAVRIPSPLVEGRAAWPGLAAVVEAGLPLLVFVVTFAWLCVGLGELRLGEGELVAGEGVNAQDEAVYSHAARGMARSGDWLTPRFMGRLFLYKPPAVYWFSGVSTALLGESTEAFRLPAVAASAAGAALVAAMAVRVGGVLGGMSAWLVLLSCPWWTALSRRNLTDPLYCLGITLAMTSAGGGWRFAAGVALAILSKGVGGAVPLMAAALLWFLPWTGLRRTAREALVDAGRVAVLAGPWFAVQLWLHPRWFFEEFIRVEFLAWGMGSAPQVSGEPAWWFYGKHFVDWHGLAVLMAGLGVVYAWRRGERGMLVPVVWAGVMTLAIGSFSFRHATYLMPLAPAFAWMTGFAPRWGRLSWVVAGTVLTVYLATAGRERPAPQREVRLLEERIRDGAPKPLLVHGTGDHFHASLLPFPELHYVFPSAAMPPKGFSLDFRSMGVAVSVDEFLDLARHRARFMREQRAWGLEGHDATASVIVYESEAELRRLREATPDYDFLESGPQAVLVPARR